MEKRIHNEALQDLAASAAVSDRARAHLNTHDSLDADVQRLFIATSPRTYIRPHRHSEAHKWEFFLLLEGSLDLLVFSEEGELSERTRMSQTDVRAVEIPPLTWHSYVCREAGTLALEVKQGPYIPTQDADFAPWSPPENDPASDEFLQWMRVATVGSSAVTNGRGQGTAL